MFDLTKHLSVLSVAFYPVIYSDLRIKLFRCTMQPFQEIIRPKHFNMGAYGLTCFGATLKWLLEEMQFCGTSSWRRMLGSSSSV